MSTRDLHYRNSPFAHLVQLVADGLGRTPSVARRVGTPFAARPVEPALRAGWLDRLDQWFWRQRQKDVEAYLAGSRDRFELDARMRELDRARYD
jgi:hypothetical protein